jgi:hypothetical protein
VANPTEEEIKRRAYELWQAAGEPEGDADAFWYEAENDLIKKNATDGEVPPGMTQNLPV